MAIEYHEPPEQLSPETRDLHRALTSLCEEVEAIDWYQHRIDVTEDEELRALLAHNRSEEMEHAAMNLEWLRRRLPDLDEKLRTYLFTSGEITQSGEEGTSATARTHDGSLGIGALRKSET